MSVINFTNMNGLAIPTPAPGEVNVFSNSASDLSYKDEFGDINVFGALFGKGFASKKKTVDETTTSTAYQTYDTINAPADGNNFFIMIRYVWGYSSGSTDFRGQILINGTPGVEEHRQEPKDSGSDQRYHYSTFTVAQPVLGNIEVKINFAAADAGRQARMRESEIFIWRID